MGTGTARTWTGKARRDTVSATPLRHRLRLDAERYPAAGNETFPSPSANRPGPISKSAAWDNAVEQGIDTLEFEARRRECEGVDEPVFHKGEECGHVRRYSDALLMFLLRSHRPEKFRERFDHRIDDPNRKDLTVADADRLSRGQLIAIATGKPIPVREGA